MPHAAVRVLTGGVRLPPMPSIRDLVKLYKLQALKHMSQNFIMDERLTDKIVKSAGRIDTKDTVLEVGPGPGGITRSILRRKPARLILVEKDERFMPTLELLKECAGPLNTEVEIYTADILRFDIAKHVPMSENRLHLIGNLPFSISTRLLINWLNDLSLGRGAFQNHNTSMTLTFQKEVAERICAEIGDAQRCRLSIMSQIWTQPFLKFIIPGKAFVPKPDVDVGVVKLVPLKHPKTDLPFELVERVMRCIFNMRQKYCRRGYSNLLPPENRDEMTDALFELADVDPTVRPFELSVDECLRLITVYAGFIEKYPEVADYDYRARKKPLNDNID
ncbi:dimethyladenosine transferase 1, mitochondrial [Eurosta solidaginis]|uniref:dimethyladenosine transferase 1, mitochondrial n=1 Tax=Eurosta solidaginis TaxID=178769 RepID=UPI00353102AA